MKKLIICLIIIVFASTRTYAIDKSTVSITADKYNLVVNDNFNLSINLSQLNLVYGVHVKVKFEPEHLTAITPNIAINEKLSTKNHFIALNSVDNESGVIELAFTLLGDETDLDDNLSIGSINLKCLKPGTTSVIIEHCKALTKEGKAISHNVNNLSLSIMSKIKYSSSDRKTEETVMSEQVIEGDYNTTFNDISGHWAEDYIIKLSSMGIVNGISDESFAPDALITRSELAKIIGLSVNIENTNIEFSTNSFTDKSVIPSWAIEHVDKLVHLGIICGYNDNTFKPNKEITRVELAVIVDRILKDSIPHVEDHIFTDDEDIPDWGRGSVYMVRSLGIMKGYSDGSFKPNNPVTRAEVCKVVAMILVT